MNITGDIMAGFRGLKVHARPASGHEVDYEVESLEGSSTGEIKVNALGNC